MYLGVFLNASAHELPSDRFTGVMSVVRAVRTAAPASSSASGCCWCSFAGCCSAMLAASLGGRQRRSAFPLRRRSAWKQGSRTQVVAFHSCSLACGDRTLAATRADESATHGAENLRVLPYVCCVSVASCVARLQIHRLAVYGPAADACSAAPETVCLAGLSLASPRHHCLNRQPLQYFLAQSLRLLHLGRYQTVDTYYDQTGWAQTFHANAHARPGHGQHHCCYQACACTADFAAVAMRRLLLQKRTHMSTRCSTKTRFCDRRGG